VTGTSARPRQRQATARGLLVVVGVSLSVTTTAFLIGRVAQSVSKNQMAPWILGRAAGVTSYLLLVLLVLAGLGLSRSRPGRLARVNIATRIRLHVTLAALTATFTVLHIVVLATDRYAGVGVMGAILPMHSTYRPVATTFGVIGFWAGLFTGLTAALAGRLPVGIWWTIHKFAIVSLVLVLLHGLLGGGDTRVLALMYVTSAAVVAWVALSRYRCERKSTARVDRR